MAKFKIGDIIQQSDSGQRSYDYYFSAWRIVSIQKPFYYLMGHDGKYKDMYDKGHIDMMDGCYIKLNNINYNKLWEQLNV